VTILLVFPTVSYADPEGPQRVESFLTPYTIYHWWLTTWESGNVVCELFLEHEGQPTDLDIFNACGDSILEEWQGKGSCASLTTGDPACSGYYLHFKGSYQSQRTVLINLPEPEVTISLLECNPHPDDGRCLALPRLQFTAIEPLPNEEITRIEVSIEGNQSICEGNICIVELQPTLYEGVSFSFYARSSYGDTSPFYHGLLRLLATPEKDQTPAGWYLDVISPQWRGTQQRSCSLTWEAFPLPGGSVDWLTTPTAGDFLSTEGPLYYLAGALIRSGTVDAFGCPGYGLEANGSANQCGLEAAYDHVIDWQNRFDVLIFEEAQQAGIPATLLKRLFEHESQFWPGILSDPGEAGFGHLTSDGADVTFLWNETFFANFCPLVLSSEVCLQGYPQLTTDQQAMLRGALFNQVNADCPACPLGIDLTQADFSIHVFAQTLLANCEQVGRMTRNLGKDSPGNLASYEDLWRLTLANYHAGPGCVSEAMSKAWSRSKSFSWESVDLHFTEGCETASWYVDAITR
jgi:hypothetical protein